MRDEHPNLEEVTRCFPVSDRWRRVLLERLAAAAVVHGLAGGRELPERSFLVADAPLHSTPACL